MLMGVPFSRVYSERSQWVQGNLWGESLDK